MRWKLALIGAGLMMGLMMGWLWIMLFDVVRYNRHLQQPLGFRWTQGPFQLERWVEGMASRTPDVVPVHSHNDYWRKHPLFDALEQGCKLVEADVWWFDLSMETATQLASSAPLQSSPAHRFRLLYDEVFVGHTMLLLLDYRTLNAMYLDYLKFILEEHNPEGIEHGGAWLGVYTHAPKELLILILDFKTEALTTLSAVQQKLHSLMRRGFLSYYTPATGEYVEGPITVVILGHTPLLHYVQEQAFLTEPWFTFLDLPLEELHADGVESAKWKDVIPFAKMALLDYALWVRLDAAQEAGFTAEEVTRIHDTGELNPDQQAYLKQTIGSAASTDLTTRLWGVPALVMLNEETALGFVFGLMEAGVGLVNADRIEMVLRMVREYTASEYTASE